MPGTAVNTLGVLTLSSSQRSIITPVCKLDADVNYLAQVQPGLDVGHLYYHGLGRQGCPLSCPKWRDSLDGSMFFINP